MIKNTETKDQHTATFTSTVELKGEFQRGANEPNPNLMFSLTMLTVNRECGSTGV